MSSSGGRASLRDDFALVGFPVPLWGFFNGVRSMGFLRVALALLVGVALALLVGVAQALPVTLFLLVGVAQALPVTIGGRW